MRAMEYLQLDPLQIIVTGAGKVLEQTVLSYAQWMALHERPHVKQIERIVWTMRV